MSECGWQGSKRSSETDIGSEDSDHEGETCEIKDLGWVHVDAQNEVVVDAETEEPVHRCFEGEERDGLPAGERSNDGVVARICAFLCDGHPEDAFVAR